MEKDAFFPTPRKGSLEFYMRREVSFVGTAFDRHGTLTFDGHSYFHLAAKGGKGKGIFMLLSKWEKQKEKKKKVYFTLCFKVHRSLQKGGAFFLGKGETLCSCFNDPFPHKNCSKIHFAWCSLLPYQNFRR